MHIKHNTATSVSGPDGEEIKGEGGVFDVPADLAAWLVKVHGFEEHHIAPVVDAIEVEVGKVAELIAPKRRGRPAKVEKPTDDAAPDEDVVPESTASVPTDAPAEVAVETPAEGTQPTE